MKKNPKSTTPTTPPLSSTTSSNPNPKSPKNPKNQFLKTIKMAESAYGNVFPVGRGGSTYNKAINVTPIERSNELAYKGTVTTEVKQINTIIKSKGYRLVTEIGTGNYANVYSAVNKKNKMIALKVIDLNKASNNYRLKFLPRELIVMSRVRHPHIITIYEILQTTQAIYVLMEFAPNGTLADYIRKNRAIPEDKCKTFFKPILEGFHYMHSLGISHRDIKVENVLLDRKMAPKITDFSYAKTEDMKNKRDLSRTFCGSLPYLSPEILQQKSYDPLVSDIWSLGISLYVMLCDALPFSLKDIKQMLESQLKKTWTFHHRVESNLSEPAKDIVRQMLEPNTTKRMTTTALLLHPWVKSADK